MGEYAAFPYLNHKVEDKGGRVQFVSGPKALGFDELYSPRDKRNVLHKGEKSYWRTRDRIEYCIIEDRKKKIMIITCKNLETKEALRTIFLKLDVLYFEVDAKARGNRDELTKKKDKGLEDDKALGKATVEYCLARLNIKAEPMAWPTSFAIPDAAADAAAALAAVAPPPTEAPAAPTERMCTFDKLSSDVYTELEILCPTDFEVGDIADTKLAPTVPVAEEPSPPPTDAAAVDAPTTPAPAVAAATDTAVTASADTTVPSAATVAAPDETATAAKTTTSKVAVSKSAAAPTGKKVAPAPVSAANPATKKGAAATPTKTVKGVSSKKVVPI
jgi:hypothetical protein